jgi:hypothetical protein
MIQNVVEASNKYDENKVYSLYVNPNNRHIIGMVGFVVGVEQLNDGNNFLHFNINNLTESEYYEISRSINSTEAMTFLKEDNRTITSRRILVDLMDDTMLNTKSGMIFGINNVINLRVKVVDENSDNAIDVEEIEIKNIKKNQNPMSLNDKDLNVHKIMVKNSSIVKCELLGDSVHTIKVKAVIPGVDYLWLTAYPQLMKHTEEELENIKKWLLENAGQPA